MDFKETLEKRFRGHAAAHLDVVFALATEGEAGRAELARFAVRGGQLRWLPDAAPDATFFFDSEATARAVLDGSLDPMAAFMAGRFRADGGLPLVFPLLALFRADYAVEAPP